MEHKNAYCTLLSSEDYLLGVLVCHGSGKQTNSPYPFICIVCTDISSAAKNILKSQGIIVKEEDYYIPKSYYDALQNATEEQLYYSTANKDLKKSGGHNIFNKFYIYKLTEYEKIIYIDADIGFGRNIDDLFEYPDYSGVRDYYGLCAGLLVIQPSVEIFSQLVNLAETCSVRGDGKNINYLGVDQDIFNILNEDKMKDSSHILPDYYSKSIYFIDCVDEDGLSFNISKIRTLHIVGPKPGRQKRDEFFSEHDNIGYFCKIILELYYGVINTVIKHLHNQGIQLFGNYL